MAWQTNFQKLKEWQSDCFIKVDDKIKKHELFSYAHTKEVEFNYSTNDII